MKNTLLALGLAATTLLTATLTGCLNSENSPSSDNFDDPTVTTPATTTKDPEVTTDPSKNPFPYEVFIPNPDFSVDEENITAEQVLENLDEMATDFAEMNLYNGQKIDRNDYKFSASFINFTPNIFFGGYESPYSPLEIQKVAEQPWFTILPDLPYSQKNTDSIDGYYTSLELHYENYRESNNIRIRLLMPQKEYEALMEAYGLKKYVLTYDEIKDSELLDYLWDYINVEVYDSFTLDRKKIESSTPEQLLAINNLLKAMYNINLIGTNTPLE